MSFANLPHLLISRRLIAFPLGYAEPQGRGPPAEQHGLNL
jgi:hypothetical protein